jgi:hypothetical protein
MTSAPCWKALKEAQRLPDPAVAATACKCQRVYENMLRREAGLEVARATVAAEAKEKARLAALGLRPLPRTVRTQTLPSPRKAEVPSEDEPSDGSLRASPEDRVLALDAFSAGSQASGVIGSSPPRHPSPNKGCRGNSSPGSVGPNPAKAGRVGSPLSPLRLEEDPGPLEPTPSTSSRSPPPRESEISVGSVPHLRAGAQLLGTPPERLSYPSPGGRPYLRLPCTARFGPSREVGPEVLGMN